MKYKDNKWSITYDKKDGLRIHIKCECKFEHDIHLDSKGNFQGRGTLLNRKKKEFNCAS